jgi:flagellar hook-associated protein 3 FlgL
MSGALTLRFSTQAQLDIRRMTQELSELQRQVASGSKSNDLRGFGGGASRLINAQGLKAVADARASTVNQLEARFGIQAQALSQIATAADSLAQSIRNAISANDGRAIGTDLNLAFSSLVSGLNETWNGQPLFAGERLEGSPVRISTLDELQAAATPDDIFDEATRHQVIDLGAGTPIVLASKASEMSAEMFQTLRALYEMIDGAGGEIGAPMTAGQITELQMYAEQLEDQARTFTNAEGRAGQLQKRFAAERIRLQDRSNLLLKEIGDQADADLAMVSVQISSLLVQYEAAAKTFSDLSKLTLLDYL